MKDLLNKAATLAGTTVGMIQINTSEMKSHYLNAKQSAPKTKANVLDAIKDNNNAMLDYVSTMKNYIQKRDN